jgi:Ca2+-binding RTX toxin-like protein
MLAIAPAAQASEYDDCHYGVTVVGSRHADRLVGTNCDDTIYGLAGNDRIRGLYGTDRLLGNGGDDLISDPSDEGTIVGGRGWDTCIVREDSQIEVLSCEEIVLL